MTTSTLHPAITTKARGGRIEASVRDGGRTRRIAVACQHGLDAELDHAAAAADLAAKCWGDGLNLVSAFVRPGTLVHVVA